MLNATPPGPAHMGPHHPAHMGPPHFVDLHINPGAHLTFQLTDGNETILTGPASITMISEYTFPPVPVPVQVPPGHMVHQIVDEHGTLKHIILSLDETTNPDGSVQPTPSLSQLGLTASNFPSVGAVATLDRLNQSQHSHSHPHHHHHQHLQQHHDQHHSRSDQLDQAAVDESIVNGGDAIKNSVDHQHQHANNDQGTIEPVKHVTKTSLSNVDESPSVSNDEHAIGSNPSFEASYDGCAVVGNDDLEKPITTTMTRNVSLAFNSSTKNICNHHRDYDEPNATDIGLSCTMDKDNVKNSDSKDAPVSRDSSKGYQTIVVDKDATLLDNCIPIKSNELNSNVTRATISTTHTTNKTNIETDDNSFHDKILDDVNYSNLQQSIEHSNSGSVLSNPDKNRHLKQENDMICSNDNINDRIEDNVDNDVENKISDIKEDEVIPNSPKQDETTKSELSMKKQKNNIVTTTVIPSALTETTITTTTNTITTSAPATTQINATTGIDTTIDTNQTKDPSEASYTNLYSATSENYPSDGAVFNNDNLATSTESLMATTSFSTVMTVPIASHHSVPPSYTTYTPCCCCCFCAQPGSVTGLPLTSGTLNHTSTSPGSLRVPPACLSGLGGIASSATASGGTSTANGLIAFSNGPMTGPGPPPPLPGPKNLHTMQPQAPSNSLHHQHVPTTHHIINNSNSGLTTSTTTRPPRCRGANIKQQLQRNSSSSNNNSNITQQSHNNHQQQHHHLAHNHNNNSHHNITGHNSEKQQTNSGYNSGGYNINNNINAGSSSKRISYHHGSSNGGMNANNLNIHSQSVSYHNIGLSGSSNTNSNVINSSSNYNLQHNGQQHNIHQIPHLQNLTQSGFTKLHQQASQRTSNIKNVVSNMNSNNSITASNHHQRTTSASPTQHSKSSSHNIHHSHKSNHAGGLDRSTTNHESNSYHHNNHHYSGNGTQQQQQQLGKTQVSIDQAHGTNHYHNSSEQSNAEFVNEDNQHNVQSGVGKTPLNNSSSYKLSYKHDNHHNTTQRQSAITDGNHILSNTSKPFHNLQHAQNVTIFSSHNHHHGNNKSTTYHNHDNHQSNEFSHNQSNDNQIITIISHNNNSGKQHNLANSRQSFEPHYNDSNQNHIQSPWHQNPSSRPHNQQSVNHNNRLNNNLKQSTNELNGHQHNQDTNVHATHHHPYSSTNSYREVKNKECHTIVLANNNNNQLSSANSNSSFSSSTSSRHNYHSSYNPTTTSTGVIPIIDHDREFQMSTNKSSKGSNYHQNAIRSNITVTNAQTNLASNLRNLPLTISTKNRNQLTSSVPINGPITIKQRPQSASGKSVTLSNNNNHQLVGRRHQVPIMVNKSRTVLQPNTVGVKIYSNKQLPKHHHRNQTQTTADNRTLSADDDREESKGYDSIENDASPESKAVDELIIIKTDKRNRISTMVQVDDVDERSEHRDTKETENKLPRSQSSSSVSMLKISHLDELSDRHDDDERSTGCRSPGDGTKISQKKTLQTNSSVNRTSKKQLIGNKASSTGHTRQTNVPEKKSCSTSTDDHFMVTSDKPNHLTTATNYTQTNLIDEQTNTVTLECLSDKVHISSESSPSTNSTGDSIVSSKHNRASKRACARDQQNASATNLKNVPMQHSTFTDDDDLQLIVTIDKESNSGSGILLEMAKIETKFDNVSCHVTSEDSSRNGTRSKKSTKIVHSSCDSQISDDNDLYGLKISSSNQEFNYDDENADSGSDSNYCTPNKTPMQHSNDHGDLSTSSECSKDKTISADKRKITSFDDCSSSASNNQNSDNNFARDQIATSVKSSSKKMAYSKKSPNSNHSEQLQIKTPAKHIRSSSKQSTSDRSVSASANTFVVVEDSSTSLSDANMSETNSDLIDDQKSSIVEEDHIESTPKTDLLSSAAKNSYKDSQDMQRSSQQQIRKNNTPNRITTKSLPQLKILNLHCTSITSTSVQLRWSYLPTAAEKYGCVNNQSKLFSEHFVVEMGTRKTSDGQSIASSKVIYQGNGTTFKASHLNAQNLYHFRVRRSTTLSISSDTNIESDVLPNSINNNNNCRDTAAINSDVVQQTFRECLVVSEIMSVTLPSHHHNHSKQRGNKSTAPNNCDSQNSGDNQAECYNSGQLGSSSSLQMSTGVSSGVGSCGKSSSSQRSSRNKSSIGVLPYIKNPFLGIGRAIKGSLTNYSDRKAAVLLCILFILSAMILAISVQYLLL